MAPISLSTIRKITFDFAILDVHFVATEDNGNVFAHTNQITVPIGNVLVGDASRDVEHDNRALALDVIAIAKTYTE